MTTKTRKKRWAVSVLTAAAVLGSSLIPLSSAGAAAAIPVSIQVDTGKDRSEISPYIYGTNAGMDMTGTEGFTARRLGGNRMTGYNWENNASNAGSDWYHSSDSYMCSVMGIPDAPGTTECDTPGLVHTKFHDQSLQQDAYSLLTLQMAGYVALDKNGEVAESETAPSVRWSEVQFSKGAPFSTQPDLTDGQVYMDEFVHFMVDKYGSAAESTGVQGYSLDNEPGLWSHTHARIHPNPVGARELVDRSASLSRAVKAVDPAAEVFGGVFYGFGAYLNLQEASDWEAVRGNHKWYIDYYLNQMKQASEADGQRLLDVLDVHWYPEARGGGQRITFEGVGNTETKKARLQAPRTLWDPTYQEDSWIGQYFGDYLPLLPQLKQSIDQHYPGTKLAMTEYNYGGEGDISGGLAQADVLGIMGKYGVYMANFWQIGEDTSYVSAAYKLYRNYDGSGSAYGSTNVRAVTSDLDNSSVHASVADETNNELHLIVLNKNMEAPLQADIAITGDKTYSSGRVFGFDAASPNVTEAAPVTNIAGNRFTYMVPPLTAYHIVLKASGDNNNPPETAPDAPTGLKAIAGEQSVTLSWNASVGATSYIVKRAAAGSSSYVTLASQVAGTTYTDTDVSAGTTYHYVVSAVNSKGVSPNSASVSAKPTGTTAPPETGLVLQYRAGDTDAGNNQIKPHFNIRNTGTKPVNLSDLKIRYYFSKDSSASMNAWIDWAQVGGSNINRTFADDYVELSFTPGAGTLAAGGQTGDIQLRMAKNDWSNFDESNDYSFDPAKTSYTNWDKVTLYHNGTLVWGIEP
ncbi:glycoside hydrolase family 44 protein [Paenibacillus tarimensis]|uniref:glycoside hydrolase family 44 protein n=1 Tax=Paenibacillus tarimensis TaxID=416012 RepID=UPI001F1B3EEA|nr:glycoside hydrolase family 44 protein [Paenibacillus tarimensis]MCF2945639.1 fibronectin type III domain-containing protein [Paenibacillus tarimensis]